jgi:alkyldihydroxyacetonephosphate synthase
MSRAAADPEQPRASDDDSITATAALVADLAGILGPGNVSASPVTRLAYARDAYPLAIRDVMSGGSRWMPDVVAWPTETRLVAEALRVAARHHVAVVPYGGGSGIVGGALGGRGKPCST